MNMMWKAKKVIKKGKGLHVVLDTSALSNYFDGIVGCIEGEDKITFVIPEGVSHEISVGRKYNELCREIYQFIEECFENGNKKIKIDVTDDNKRSWTVDEQVVYTAEKYYKKGYNTILVTCDRDQKLKAQLKNIRVELLKVEPKRKEKEYYEDEYSYKKPEAKQKSVEEDVQSGEIKIPAKKQGKDYLLYINRMISVIDAKGKKKIARVLGNNQQILLSLTDKIYYNEKEAEISRLENDAIYIRLNPE